MAKDVTIAFTASEESKFRFPVLVSLFPSKPAEEEEAFRGSEGGTVVSTSTSGPFGGVPGGMVSQEVDKKRGIPKHANAMFGVRLTIREYAPRRSGCLPSA